jgi:ketosteroid isomerase-like protein
MHPNAELIAGFYAAFQRRDHAAMAACYAPDATFSDPVFRDLRGPRVGAMWRMLCERATDLRIEASVIEADGDRGSARWEAWYTFAATGRPVHNIIQASFEFRDGLIAHHRDAFDLTAWARQALGIKGLLLGWTPPVQHAIRAQAARGLDAFIRKQGRE